MLIVPNLQATNQIQNPAIRALVQSRINELSGEAFDTDSSGYFLVIEPGDTIQSISTKLGFNILQNRFTGIRFEATGFTPSFEFIQEFASCFDIVFVLDDSGFGVELFVPKSEAIDPDLIAMCRVFAFKEDAP